MPLKLVSPRPGLRVAKSEGMVFAMIDLVHLVTHRRAHVGHAAAPRVAQLCR
jgi:hypothetical protein